MKNFAGFFLVPHPPIIIPEVGKGQEQSAIETITAYRRFAERVKELRPDTIIVLSPHGVQAGEQISIALTEVLSGTMAQFGAVDVTVNTQAAIDLANDLVQTAQGANLPVYGSGKQRVLDHGTFLPLYFLQQVYTAFKLISIIVGDATDSALLAFGQVLGQVVTKQGKRVVVVASGDLSHRLLASGPYGFAQRGVEFDETIHQMLASGKLEELQGIDWRWRNEAAQCAMGPLLILSGVLTGQAVRAQIYSHEYPYGVGYMVAEFTAEEHDIRVKLAKLALETYLQQRVTIEPSADLPEVLLKERAGAFVSLHKQGQLRGCIGTIMPTQSSLAAEIIYCAIQAGTRDPRFPAVSIAELAELVYSVDVLAPAEKIADMTLLDPAVYGVIVSKDYRRSLLLPDLDGVETAAQQVAIALQKAGIQANEDYALERFRVVRHQ